MADFGEILQNVGEFGLFQKLTLFALCFPNFSESFVFASFIFIELDPDRRCNTDWILRADPNLTTDEQLNLTLPRNEDGTFSRCRMFVPVDWDITAIREYGLNETTGCQSGWVYHNTLYEATIVTDFGLVCEKAKMVGVIQAVFMAGVLIGSLAFGPLAESFGRKRANQIPVVIIFIFTVTTAVSPNVYVYLASQFLVGFGGGGFRVNCTVLSTEWLGPSKRSWGPCLIHLFDAVGQCSLAVMIYSIRDWRLVQLITLAPLTVVVIYIWFIPESARWLLNRGRTQEAKQLIAKVAAMNKRPVPDSLLEQIEMTQTVKKGGIQIIFRSPLLTKYFLTLILAWFSVNLALYCVYLNMGNFGLNIFLTQFLFGVIEMPSTLLSMWLLEVFGRKVLFIITMFIGGLASLLILAVPEGYAIVVTALAVLVRFFLIWSSSICAVFIQELFPTSVRQTATALGTIAARMGALLAPLLNILAMYHAFIPITVFSSLTLVSGGLGFLLPETRKKELPETVDEAENNRNVTSDRTDGPPYLQSVKL